MSRAWLVDWRKKDKTSDDLEDRPFVIPSSQNALVRKRRIEEKTAARMDRKIDRESSRVTEQSR